MPRANLAEAFYLTNMKKINIKNLIAIKGVNARLAKPILASFLHPSVPVKETLFLAQKIMASRKPIVYIGGGLTGQDDDIKIKYEKTGKMIDQMGGFGYVPHVYGTDPVKHPDVSPEDVRNIDFLWSVLLPSADIFWCDNPSFGVGIEMAWAEIYDIPSIKIHNKNITVSRMPRGLYHSQILAYNDIDDAYKLIKKNISVYLKHHDTI